MRKILIQILAVWLLVHPVFAAAGDQAAAAAAQPCQIFGTNGGYFFDDFNQHEYINGLLVWHLRLKTPFNDGRPWKSGVYAYQPNCGLVFEQLDIPGFAPRPKMQNFSIRFTSPTHFDFWDDEEDIPFDCGGKTCGADIPPDFSNGALYNAFSYQGVIDNASSVITESLPITAATAQIPPKEPVLIVPGLLGSELGQPGRTYWPSLPDLVADPSDGFMDILDLNPNGTPVDGSIQAGGILSKIDYAFGSFDYSAGLIDSFKSAGYAVDQNLFIYPYDWRLGVQQNADGLARKIQNVLNLTGASKLNVIAHSLGGLVVKEYLADNAQSGIDNLVLAGVPNLGSAEAAHDLIFGSDLGIPLLNSGEVQKLSQNMPSIYDLLPSRAYFQHSAGFYDDLSSLQLKTILNYDQSKNLLLSLGKNQALLSAAEQVHDALDSQDFSAKVGKIYNIVGCGQFTLKTINKMYDGEPGIVQRLVHGPKYRIAGDSGDGTVLISSARELAGATNYYVRAEHAKMLSAPELKQSLIQLATGQSVSGLATDPGNCGISGKLVSMNSALNFSITDALNNPVNPDAIQQIRTGNDLHLFLPTDSGQKYKISIKPADVKIPVDLSIAKVQPTQTIIYNYDQINLQSQAIAEITPDSNSVQNTDSQGINQDVPPTDSVDQNDLGNTDPTSQGDPAPAPQVAPAPAPAPTPAPIPVYVAPPAPQVVPSPAVVPSPQTSPNPQIAPDPQILPDPSGSSGNPDDSVADDPGPQDNLGSADQSATAGGPAGPTVAPNININLQIGAPPQSSQAQAPPKPDQNAAAPQTHSETVVINPPESSTYWNLLGKLFHLIFF